MPESDRIEQIRKIASSKDRENTPLANSEKVAAMRASKPIPGRLVTFADESQSLEKIAIEGTIKLIPENDQSPTISESKDNENN